jgi:amidohydrolase
MSALDEAKKVNDWVFAIRREFHADPEKSMEEYRTSARVAEELGKMGIPVKRIGKTGVLGTLEGKLPGKVLALRADMDALSIQEQTGFDYSSKNPGVMHACGHDFHTAILLGAAKVLSGMKDQLKGTIKFLFQPSEETAMGAKLMVEGGALENPKVDMAFGLHVIADLPIGKVVLQDGGFMASGDNWECTIKGVTAHGSSPWQGVDALVCSAAVVQSLQTLVSRVNDARDPIVVNIGTIHGGDRFNIIPSKVEMTGMNRAFSVTARESMPKWMEEVIKGTCAAYRCQYEFNYHFSCAPLINDPKATSLVKSSVAKVIGAGNILQIPRIMGSEDFSEYAMKVPSTFMVLGVRNPAKDCVYSQHSEHYKADEDCLPTGVASFVQVALDFLS